MALDRGHRSRARIAGLPHEGEILSRRALGRALLERQLLLRRADRSPRDVVEHLLGLQAQATLPPYLGLWSRIEGFDPNELGAMLTGREAVRLTLMRGTVHLVTVRDALLLRPLVAAGDRARPQRGLRAADGRRGPCPARERRARAARR